MYNSLCIGGCIGRGCPVSLHLAFKKILCYDINYLLSVLVLTHCEHLSEEERGEMINCKQFKKDHPSVASLMDKRILAVGFPDSSHIQPGLHMCMILNNN